MRCSTCRDTGLVPPTVDRNAGGPGYCRCPDCPGPEPDPKRQRELERIRDIQRSMFHA